MEIPGYRIERLIAEGGMSSVYLAVQESLGRRVALKVLKKFDCAEHAERFLSEARTIASLEHHYIITIHDVGTIGERHYIAMEYLEGGSLRERIDAGIPPMVALDLLERIAACLDFVHRRGVVHRDIKPGNILFHADGTPKLSDFGIAKQLAGNQELTMDGSAFGSPYYLSPEQAEGGPLDGRSDIYALGIMFYQMLTGRQPYAERSHIETIVAHLIHPIPLLPNALAAYQGLFERMTAKRPQDRIASAAQLIEQIRAARQAAALRADRAGGRPLRSGSGLIQAVSRAFREASATTKVVAGSALLAGAVGTLLLPGMPDGERPAVAIAAPAPPAAAAVAGAKAAGQAGSTAPPAAVQRAELAAPVQPTAIADAAQIASPEPPASEAVPRPTGQAMPEAPALATPPPATDLSGHGSGSAVVEGGLAARKPDDRRDTTGDAAAVTAQNTAAPISTVPPMIDDPTDTGERAIVEALMRRGDRALQRFRLTTPSDDNALLHYTQVLERDPQHAGARAGIDEIADRYAALARKALRDRDYRLSRVYLRRGLLIRKDHAGLRLARRDLDKAQRATVPRPVRTAQPAPAPPVQPEPIATHSETGTGNFFEDLRNAWRSIVN